MDLLGNYSESSSDAEEEIEPEIVHKKPKVWLPPPDLRTAAMKADDEKEFIYRSKFDREKQSVERVLEQHVTLSDTSANKFEKERDGKKICWNYRKGRCYKGHNCPMFHDGDIALGPRSAAQSSDGPNFRNASRGPSDADITKMLAADVKDDGDSNINRTKKRRHGLTNSLAPSKGAMKQLQTQDEHANPHRYTAPALPKNARIAHFPS